MPGEAGRGGLLGEAAPPPRGRGRARPGDEARPLGGWGAAGGGGRARRAGGGRAEPLCALRAAGRKLRLPQPAGTGVRLAFTCPGPGPVSEQRLSCLVSLSAFSSPESCSRRKKHPSAAQPGLKVRLL